MKKGMLTRILVGLGLSVLFIGLWFAIGFVGKSTQWYRNIIQLVVFAAVNCLCVYEMQRVMKAKGMRTTVAPYFAAALVGGWILLGLKYAAFFLFLIVFCAVAIRLFDKSAKYEDLFAEIDVYIYPILPLCCLFKVCTGHEVQLTQLTMLFTFACPLFGDTLAYFFGMAFGKRKLCERISPKKTIAGSIGGMFGGAVAGLCCYALQPMIAYIFGVPQTTYSIAMLTSLGLLLGIVGQIGDLFASCIKRWAGVKDFGNIFPGHGGMLDRIDSVLMCAPFVVFVFYALV